ncbi:hypothetical protein B0A54_04683 [Friedmanniomyces endolithicus]|uniref:Yeast cell wall synthesis Kre9/Knh1-like N-terminal domain-containing protein n=1 Tax=Friedmanniomyces endolithicus TaxID=329885 RepID=A0A4U0V8J5_9PEZI|nr:hypothetical protein LTS09_008591 [Friedmanniomyces endolithicus]TKA44732.1 hypothetical protein B0A54_04683 [Friedmanniomyces endolithicus]
MLSKLLLASAFAAIAAAQSKVLNFTAVPAPFTDGQAYALTYATNDTNSPVTIVLLQGPSATGLQPVATLNADIHGGQYVWTPPTTLPAANDYALQILQGNQVNYFGPFQILAATAPASSSTSSTAASSSSATTTTAAATPLGPVVVSSTSVSTNGSVSATLPVTSMGTTTMSAGTGIAMPRNTTMAMATLSSSSSASMAAVVPVTSAAVATVSSTGAGALSSALASGVMPATTNGAAGVGVGSGLAVVLGCAGVVFYLL